MEEDFNEYEENRRIRVERRATENAELIREGCAIEVEKESLLQDQIRRVIQHLIEMAKSPGRKKLHEIIYTAVASATNETATRSQLLADRERNHCNF